MPCAWRAPSQEPDAEEIAIGHVILRVPVAVLVQPYTAWFTPSLYSDTMEASSPEAPNELAKLPLSPHAVVAAALELARVGPGDVLVDVGCGSDARVCIAAAQRGATCVGVELREAAVLTARAAVSAALSSAGGVSLPTVAVQHADALDDCVSFHDASIVFLYLLPRGNAAVAAKLEAQLRPGSRVVCHMFRMPAAWDARLRETTSVSTCRPGGVDTSAFTKLFLYVM